MSCFSLREIQALSGHKFTLDGAASAAGDNSLCTEYCSPSHPFLAKQHSGHIWLNAPYGKLTAFVKHYIDCKAKQPELSACILVPGGKPYQGCIGQCMYILTANQHFTLHNIQNTSCMALPLLTVHKHLLTDSFLCFLKARPWA